MFAAKEQNFKICNFSTRSLSVTLSQPIMIPNNFHFIESIPLLYREMLISETAVINIYIVASMTIFQLTMRLLSKIAQVQKSTKNKNLNFCDL